MPLYLGRGQIGICQRCGFKRRRVELVEDGRIANLLVCVDTCYDAEHPQDFPALPRPEGLPPLRPSPENLGAGQSASGETFYILTGETLGPIGFVIRLGSANDKLLWM